MNALIPFMNRLHNILSVVGRDTITLPKIVVIGAQSSGKSSVLESLVGRSFIPRGLGVVTRRPMILRLTYLEDKTQEHGKFMHLPNVIFKDYAEIRNEIEQETARKAGPNKGISDEPIVLDIYSPKVVNLTLVDLPGLTKVPVGDQPADIDKQVKNLSLKYIRNPSTIILAVVAANTDMSTNECLQMARQVDPNGNRTVAVVTKLDIMDAGTNATEMLKGNIVPVPLGVIGVVNRSHLDTLSEKTLEQTQDDEKSFFQSKYAHIAHQQGAQYLGKTLNRILVKHINNTLPGLKHTVTSQRTQAQEELSAFDDGLDCNQVILREVSQYAEAYKGALSGSLREIQTQELTGGARICYVFHDIFANKLDTLKPTAGLTLQQLHTALRNSAGTRSDGLFIPENCFENLVRKQLKQLETPCLQVVKLIHDELLRMVRPSAVGIKARRFPRLYDSIFATLEDLLSERLISTKALVQQLLDMEYAYINTKNLSFQSQSDVEDMISQWNQKTDLKESKSSPSMTNMISITGSLCPDVQKCDYSKESSSLVGGWLSALILPSSKAIAAIPSTRSESPAFPNRPDTAITVSFSNKETQNVRILEKLVTNYFDAVRRSLKDTVPKAIMLRMVNSVHESVYKELLERLYKADKVEHMLWEPDEIQRQRTTLLNSVRALRSAEKMLWEMREQSAKMMLAQ